MELEDGGRRSRRGFAYQDAVTLLDCLELGRMYREVRFEDLDDIVCIGIDNDFILYRQVKTREGGARHSLSTVCMPELPGRIETSILGRLFTGKHGERREQRFGLVFNVEPQNDLQGFYCDRSSRPAATTEQKLAVCGRMSNLVLPEGCSIAERVHALEVIVEGRTINDVERLLVSKLRDPITKHLGGPPLLEEIEAVLSQLLSEVSRDAHAPVPKAWTATTFTALLEQVITAATCRRSDGGVEPLPRLSAKLRVANLTIEEIRESNDALLRFRRSQRSAVGQERRQLDRLSDEVFAATTRVSAKRRAGQIEAGAVAYAATVDAVCEVAVAEGVATSLALQALSDVTARCQNRYSDAT